jgi:hypothetical protein
MRLVTRLSRPLLASTFAYGGLDAVQHPRTPDVVDFVRLNRAVPVSAGVVLATGRWRTQQTIHFLKNRSMLGGARQRAAAKRKRTITNMPKRARRALGKQGAAVAKRKRTGGRTPKTRAELYEEAKRRNLPGRSKMGRAELARALGHK